MDIVSVLELQKGRLDYEYFAERAKAADVTGLLKVLMNEVA